MNYVDVVCRLCDKPFQKTVGAFNRTKNHFCSKSCSARYNCKHYNKSRLKGSCDKCQIQISSSRKYCNTCWSSFYEDRKYRTETNKCYDCGNKSKGYRCMTCYKIYRLKNSNLVDNKTPILKGSKKSYYYSYCHTCNKPCNGKRCQKCHIKHCYDDTCLLDISYKDLPRPSLYAKIRTRARAIAKRMGWKSCINCGYSKHIEVCHKKPISSFNETSMVSEVNHIDNLIPLCPNCHWEFDKGDLTIEQINSNQQALDIYQNQNLP